MFLPISGNSGVQKLMALMDTCNDDIILAISSLLLPRDLANLAFGGADRKTIYITESLSGDILMAKMPVAGKVLYGHM